MPYLTSLSITGCKLSVSEVRDTKRKYLSSRGWCSQRIRVQVPKPRLHLIKCVTEMGNTNAVVLLYPADIFYTKMVSKPTALFIFTGYRSLEHQVYYYVYFALPTWNFLFSRSFGNCTHHRNLA